MKDEDMKVTKTNKKVGEKVVEEVIEVTATVAGEEVTLTANLPPEKMTPGNRKNHEKAMRHKMRKIERAAE